MNYIKITNRGQIEPQALHLVGASTKRNDASKIGQFGSGNKYALAYLIRNQYNPKIYSGTQEIEISTVKESFRGEEFNIVCINGEKTSITSEMGKDWKFWQAVREIYCNAIDEGGHSIEFVQNIEPIEGFTQFYIENKGEVMEFMSNFDTFFANPNKVLFECEHGRILKKSGTTANIFRKGIRCHNSQKQSSYDYDFSNIAVNEDRLVMYSWQIDEKIWKLIYSCTDKEVIRNIICKTDSSDFIEGCISDIASIDSSHMSNEFKEVLSDLKIAPKGMSGLLNAEEYASTVVVPTKVFESVRGVLSDDNVASKFRISSNGAFFRKIEYTKLYEATMTKALEFLKEVGMEIPYEIHLAVFDNKNILGCAYKGEIFVSETCMEKGINEVVNTLIEEYIHIKYEVQDETRVMQTALITEWIAYMKKVNAYVL